MRGLLFRSARASHRCGSKASGDDLGMLNQQLLPDGESVRFHDVCLLRTVVCAERIDSRERERTLTRRRAFAEIFAAFALRKQLFTKR
jgi:hypothetical protein